MGAAMLLVEIGADMTRFGRAEKLASWVGICPGNERGQTEKRKNPQRQRLGEAIAL